MFKSLSDIGLLHIKMHIAGTSQRALYLVKFSSV